MWETAILGIAPVALQQVADREVEVQIQHRGSEQDSVGRVPHVIGPRDRARRGREHDDGYTDPLRKILPNEELFAATYQALTQWLVGGHSCRRRLLPVTVGTRDYRLPLEWNSAGVIAFWTGKSNIHRSQP